jgi:hypothetical protein
MIMEVVAERDQGRGEVADGGAACFNIFMERKISEDRKVSREINSWVGKWIPS